MKLIHRQSSLFKLSRKQLIWSQVEFRRLNETLQCFRMGPIQRGKCLRNMCSSASPFSRFPYFPTGLSPGGSIYLCISRLENCATLIKSIILDGISSDAAVNSTLHPCIHKSLGRSCYKCFYIVVVCEICRLHYIASLY
jgi:hypothetical protein